MSNKRVKPLPLEIIYLDEIAGKISDLIEESRLERRLRRPVQEILRFPERYQTIEIPANSSRTIYYLKVRAPYWAAIITEVANGPTNISFATCYFTWYIDGVPREPAIMRYSLAPVTDPKHERIIAYDEVKWVGTNEDSEAHDFEVVTDGIFIERKILDKITPFTSAYKEM